MQFRRVPPLYCWVVMTDRAAIWCDPARTAVIRESIRRSALVEFVCTPVDAAQRLSVDGALWFAQGFALAAKALRLTADGPPYRTDNPGSG